MGLLVHSGEYLDPWVCWFLDPVHAEVEGGAFYSVCSQATTLTWTSFIFQTKTSNTPRATKCIPELTEVKAVEALPLKVLAILACFPRASQL